MSAERVERRLAAILAADVGGYSRLMGEDEAGTLARLRTHRRELIDPKVAAHKGRIVKTTGDGLLIEFPSVVEAVACALAVQQGMAERNADVPSAQRIVFRVGINLGDVIVEDGDIHGDGVNVAARLETLAEPGEICVSAVVRDQVQGRLDCAFDDLGEQSLKNIARPVRVYRVALTHRVADAPRSPLSCTAGEGAERSEAGEGLALPDKPSIAVLPFQNMSGDPEQEYFADGIVEEITTAIARLPWLFVIARNSSFTYKGKSVDVKQVARELGVRYVLEGSVRKGGNRVRIAGQLIDTATGAHIWANRFDGALDDVFDLQDQVASSVAGAIEPKLRLAEIERARRKPIQNLDAHDLYLRALAQFYSYSDAGFREAITLCRQALGLNSAHAPAAAMIGICRVFQRWQGGPMSDEDVTAALRSARLALDITRDDPDVLSHAAWTLFYVAGETAMAEALLDRALSLNPNASLAWMMRGHIHAWRNQPEPAIAALERALRLSPLDPLGFYSACGLAIAHLGARRFEQAIQWADRALHDRLRFTSAMRIKVIALVHLDRIEEARAQLGRLLEMQPGLTIAAWHAFRTPGAAPEMLDLWASGLRRAGLPEE